MIFKNVLGYFSQVGKVRNTIFSLSLSLRRDGGMGFPDLARNGYVTLLGFSLELQALASMARECTDQRSRTRHLGFNPR